jgi:hypothetical protein
MMQKLSVILMTIVIFISTSQSLKAADNEGNQTYQSEEQNSPKALHQKNRIERQAAKQYRREHPNPFVAGLLSAAVPGLGEVYSDHQYLKGGMMFGILAGGGLCMALGNQYSYNAIASIGSASGNDDPQWTDKNQVVSPLFYVGAGIVGLDWVWSVIDAPLSANRISQANTSMFRPRIEGTELAINFVVLPTSGGVKTICNVNF